MIYHHCDLPVYVVATCFGERHNVMLFHVGNTQIVDAFMCNLHVDFNIEICLKLVTSRNKSRGPFKHSGSDIDRIAHHIRVPKEHRLLLVNFSYTYSHSLLALFINELICRPMRSGRVGWYPFIACISLPDSKISAAQGRYLIAWLSAKVILAARRLENPCVGGSIPPRATKNIAQLVLSSRINRILPRRLRFFLRSEVSSSVRTVGSQHATAATPAADPATDIS